MTETKKSEQYGWYSTTQEKISGIHFIYETPNKSEVKVTLITNTNTFPIIKDIQYKGKVTKLIKQQITNCNIQRK